MRVIHVTSIYILKPHLNTFPPWMYILYKQVILTMSKPIKTTCAYLNTELFFCLKVAKLLIEDCYTPEEVLKVSMIG